MREEQRTEYLDALSARRADATAQGVRFWVFENNDEPGRFVEFTEAADERSVATFHHGKLPAPLWREVQGG